MRYWHPIVLALAFAASACDHTDEEWVPLFDGTTVSEWRIDGDHQIVDGALVLGGKRTTRAYLPVREFRNCEIRFQYRTEGSESAGLGWDSGNHPVHPIKHFSPKKDWQDSFVEEYYDLQHPHQRFIRGQHGASGVFAPIEALWIEVPAGNKLFLRNVHMRQGGTSPWPWILTIVIVVGGGTALVLWRWKRQKASKVPAEVSRPNA